MTSPTTFLVRQERDHVSHASIYASMFALALLLATGAILTWAIERHQPVHVGLRRDTAPVAETPREINMIDQTLFSAHLPSRGDWAAKERELNSYSWVDQRRRTAKIPIARAMQMLVERGHVD